LCGVQGYASAQILDLLDLARKSLVFASGTAPSFEVSDARLGHYDRLILLVNEGKPFKILEPADVSNSEVPADAAEGATDSEPAAGSSKIIRNHSQLGAIRH